MEPYILVALDADATAKAAKMVQQLSLYLSCKQLVLTKDIKDCTIPEREELFKHVRPVLVKEANGREDITSSTHQ